MTFAAPFGSWPGGRRVRQRRQRQGQTNSHVGQFPACGWLLASRIHAAAKIAAAQVHRCARPQPGCPVAPGDRGPATLRQSRGHVWEDGSRGRRWWVKSIPGSWLPVRCQPPWYTAMVRREFASRRPATWSGANIGATGRTTSHVPRTIRAGVACRFPVHPVSGGDRLLLAFVPGSLRKDQETYSWPITARCGQRGRLWPCSSSTRAASSSGLSRTSSGGRHGPQNTVLPPIIRLVSAGLSLWQHEQRRVSPRSTGPPLLNYQPSARRPAADRR